MSTDHNIPADKLRKAREWAQTSINTPNNFPKGRAAAEVIQSLPDEWIDAEKLREWLGKWQEIREAYGDEPIDEMESLLPAPTPRTLADMTDFYRPLTKLTPRPRTLVAIDVERAYEEHGDDIHAILDTLLPGDLNSEAVTDDGHKLQHISIQSTQNPKRRFKVRPGQQLICDRTTGTAATLYRSEIDALYSRQEITYAPES